MNQLINAKNWPARRPDDQTAKPEPNPAPPVKGTGKRPGLERIEARVPTQIGQKFKFLCMINQLEIKDVITELIDQWNRTMTGRPDGQTAFDPDLKDRLIDEEEKFASSDQPEGRPPDQPAKRHEILGYYSLLTGNQIRQNDRDCLETLLNVPTYVIRAGIAQSILRCNTRINSLRYCVGAIEEIRESGVDRSFAVYLEAVLVLEGKWNRSIVPIDANGMEVWLRSKIRNHQPELPGTAGDLLEFIGKETKPE